MEMFLDVLSIVAYSTRKPPFNCIRLIFHYQLSAILGKYINDISHIFNGSGLIDVWYKYKIL